MVMRSPLPSKKSEKYRFNSMSKEEKLTCVSKREEEGDEK
jgi:hypothetical protein